MNENQPPNKEPMPGDRDPSSGASSEPDWLREMSGDQESPDWLRRLLDDEPSADEDAFPPAREGRDSDEEDLGAEAAAEPEEPAASPGPVMPERPSTDELRQWFRASDRDQDSAPDREGLPEWLRALDATPPAADDAEQPSDIPALPDDEDEDVPDWLRDLDREPLPADEPEAAAPDAAPADRPVPDWLAELGDETSRHAPAGISAGGDRAPAPPPPEAGDDLPDWLKEMSQELAGRPEEPEEARPEPQESAPEPEPAWEAAVLPLAGPEEPAEPEPPVASGETASWDDLEAAPGEEPAPGMPPAPFEDGDLDLTEPDLPPQEAEQEPPWLAELEQEAEVEAETPDWLAEIRKEAEPEAAGLDLLEGALGAEAATPKWVQDLRPEEDAGAPGAPPSERQVETSGPLAGLSGLLSPQPVAGLSDRAVFKPAPPIPDEQHDLAARIRDLLSEPPARPELPAAAPGRPVVKALGQWLIYLALVAVIVAAMFVPALYERILPAETEAGQNVYFTLRALPAGSEVLLVIDYDAAHDGELTPVTRALLWHLVTSGQRVILVSHTPQGAAMAQDMLESRALWAYSPAPAAGVAALNLGYLPPHAASMQAFMANPVGGAALWGENTSAEATPLGQEVARFDDLDAIVLVSASLEHTRWWIEQTAGSLSTHSVPMLAGVSASIAPSLLPYGHAPGAQLSGTLVGLSGAAEYERLCGARFAPNARQNMIMQGSAQVFLAAIVLLSGITLLVRRVLGRGG